MNLTADQIEALKRAPETRSPITSRETEVLKLIALGVPNKLIAPSLFITVKTVEKHRQSLMDKLGIHSAVHLTHFALHVGLIQNRYAPAPVPA